MNVPPWLWAGLFVSEINIADSDPHSDREAKEKDMATKHES
jgi:hypothetical protein